jgi:hypothetical protein
MSTVADHYDRIAELVAENEPAGLLPALAAEPGGLDAALDVAFQRWTSRINPERTGGTDGDIQFDIATPDGETRAYTMAVRPGRCESVPGPAQNPLSSVSIQATDFLRLVTGKVSGASLGMAGKMRSTGDTTLIVRMKNWFKPA